MAKEVVTRKTMKVFHALGKWNLHVILELRKVW